MAHILIAYKQFPAPSVGHAGGASLFQLMAALHKRGYQLTLVARITDEERRHMADVAEICQRIVTVPHHTSQSGPRPIVIARSYLALRRAIRETIQAEHPDLIHVETTQTALTALGLSRPPSSYRTQDVNWFLVHQSMPYVSGLRWGIAFLKRGVFRWLERQTAERYDLLLAISEGDLQLLAEYRAPEQLLFVPLVPAIAGDAMARVAPAVDGDANLLFVGAMSREHNLVGIRWFLDAIWPQIVGAVPEARLYIVGGNPPEALRQRGDGERVVVTGFVDGLAPWYRAATVFVSPLRVAGGLLQKVMDAMAAGVPVVATSVCNHGVGAIPGEHLITADEPEAFATAVIALLRDRALRDEIGAAGKAFVAENYDLESAVDRWDSAMRDLLADA